LALPQRRRRLLLLLLLLVLLRRRPNRLSGRFKRAAGQAERRNFSGGEAAQAVPGCTVREL
jgi:hypothetical protein